MLPVLTIGLPSRGQPLCLDTTRLLGRMSAKGILARHSVIAVAALLIGWCWLAGIAVGPVLQPSPPLAALLGLAGGLLGAVNRRLPAGLLAAGCILTLAGGAW